MTAYRAGDSVKLYGYHQIRTRLPFISRMQMKPKIRIIALWALLIPLVVAGCAVAPPIQEMSDARQAIKAAREAHAEQHAAQPLHDAEMYLNKATEELQHGDYVEARKSAVAAKVEAIHARDNSVAAEQGK